MSSSACSAVTRPAPDSPVTSDEGTARVAAGGRWSGRRRAVGHGAKPRRSCGRDSRQGKAQLRSSGCLERRQRQHAAGRCRAGVSRAGSGRRSIALGRHEIDQQGDGARVPAAGRGRASRCRRRAPRSGRRALAGARGDQRRCPCGRAAVWSSATRRRAGLDQAQRQVGLAGARRPAQQHRAPASGRAARSATHVACTSIASWARHLRASAAGTRMVKRAPSTRPSGGARGWWPRSSRHRSP